MQEKEQKSIRFQTSFSFSLGSEKGFVGLFSFRKIRAENVRRTLRAKAESKRKAAMNRVEMKPILCNQNIHF